jgi:hypothetical protein
MMWLRTRASLVWAVVLGGAAASAALAQPLNPGESAWKTHPTVPELPKYTTGLPAYFVPGNVVASLDGPLTGDFGGSVISTVYRNPATGFLTFDYRYLGSPNNTVAIVRGTIGGDWLPFAVSAVGADASGTSGGFDPAPEWTDGDPLFIQRDPVTGGPSIQWRFAERGTTLGAGNGSAHVWLATNALLHTSDFAGAIDSGAVAVAPALIPLPEPATLTLLLCVLGFAARPMGR